MCGNTHVALLVAGLALNSQGRTIVLDMANTSTREALLVSKGTRQRAGRGFVTWTMSINPGGQPSYFEQKPTRLLAIEAEPFTSTVGAT